MNKWGNDSIKSIPDDSEFFRNIISVESRSELNLSGTFVLIMVIDAIEFENKVTISDKTTASKRTILMISGCVPLPLLYISGDNITDGGDDDSRSNGRTFASFNILTHMLMCIIMKKSCHINGTLLNQNKMILMNSFEEKENHFVNKII
ncbi:hypothetical protein BLOT_007571 [Blomia tropicalis]|nr:hypothetical protein BLOT_007571 [Blomia tropicalis]